MRFGLTWPIPLVREVVAMIVNLPQVLTALCVPILTGTWAAIWRMYRRYQSTQDGMKCLM